VDLARYLLGLLLTAVCVGPLIAAAHRLRERALPDFAGAVAGVAEAIAALALAVVALELAGVLGVFNLLGVTVACVVVGLAGWAAAGRIAAGPVAAGPVAAGPVAASDRHPRVGRTSRLVAAGAVGVLVAAWSARVIFAYGHGMESIDTLWYHLPWAARWVQTGSIRSLHYVDNDAVTVFYPANSELFHALGLLLFRGDLVSPLLNVGWAGLALAAGWAIGRPYGRAPHCLVAIVLVLAIPAQVVSEPGGAYNDVVCIALVLAAAAILINGGLGLGASCFAAAAAGLALGTKDTMIVPALAFAVGAVAISAPGARLRQALIWAGGLIVFGGYWYARNLVRVGNPVPSVSLHLGPLSLATPHITTPLASVAHYVTNGHVWKQVFLPGLQLSFGPAAWAIIILAAAGSLLALFAGQNRIHRIVGAVAIAGGIGFLLAPEPSGLFVFGANVGRLAGPPIALGLVLLPIQPAAHGARAGKAWLAVAAAILIATEINPSIWPTGLSLATYGPVVRGAPAVAGALIGVVVFVLAVYWRDLRRLSVAKSTRLAVGLALAVGVGGWFVGVAYAHRRYQSSAPLPVIYRWAQHIHHARIGIVGLVEQYPLYGPDDSNYVQYVGVPTPHGGFTSITDCRTWTRVVNQRRFNWLVLAPPDFPITNIALAPQVDWTRSSPGARLVLSERATIGRGTVQLFHLSGALNPAACPA
jgi:hypothetical protein